MSAAVHVFVSYSRRDVDFVSRLTNDLRQFGIEVWRDVEQIPAGADWRKVIEAAIIRADVLLSVASANSLNSEWMNRELSAFLRQRRPIIPIILDDAGAASLPPELLRLQWVDFRGGYDQGKVGLLASSLLSLGVPKQTSASTGLT